MSSNRRASFLLSGVCACAAVLACDGHARNPVEPHLAVPSATAESGMPGSLSTEFNAVDEVAGIGIASALQATGGKASGHASLQGTITQNVKDERYSFTAVLEGLAPLAKGMVEEHHVSFDGHVVMIRAEVTCAAIVGNQAWIGTRLTRLVLDGDDQPVEGLFPIFRVLDVGEGGDAADRASLLFLATTGRRFENDRSYCDARPDFPILFESTIGNIQVKSR